MYSEAYVVLANDAKPENMLNDEDSESSPRERPSSLHLETNDDNNINGEACENGGESIDTEESSIRRSVRYPEKQRRFKDSGSKFVDLSDLVMSNLEDESKNKCNVTPSNKFRLRDISPSRLRERRKGGSRKKSDKETKHSESPRKNVRSSTASWLPASFQQMFPSYKSKAGDFKRLFKNVPETEKLITDYSCALQRDILVHGRLYVSQSWLCFYANIFGWETLVTINLKHVTSMTKEKTALVIPNAIQVWTESEKYFFTSFVSRDSTYRSLSQIWQNVLSDEPVCVSALMKSVGKYLDVDSEELETSSRGSHDELPSDFDDITVDDDIDDDSLVDSEEPHCNDSPKESSLKQTSPTKSEVVEDTLSTTTLSSVPDIAVSPASPVEVKRETPIAPASVVSNGTVPRSKMTGTAEPRRKFPFPFKKDLSPLMRRKKQGQSAKRSDRDKLEDTVHRDSLIEEESITDSNDEDEAPVLCPCESHFSVECLNEEYATDVDSMYEYLFTDCDFYRSMRAARKDFDLDIDPWAEVEDKKRRSVKYTVNLNLTIGPKTTKIEEKQQLETSDPGQFYVVESSVVNEGVPYAESFYVVQRYCITRVNAYTCRMRVTATVKYARPIWSFVKNMISKNAIEGMLSFFDFLKLYLRTTEDESMLSRRQKAAKKTVRAIPESEESQEKEETGEPATVPPSKASGQLSTWLKHIWRKICRVYLNNLIKSYHRNNNGFLGLFSLLLVFLVVLNLYLGYRVISLEQSTKSWEAIGLPPIPSDWPPDLDEFRNLLYKQQHIQNLQLKRWQQVLSTSMQFLQQVQDSLSQLQKEIENPLSE